MRVPGYAGERVAGHGQLASEGTQVEALDGDAVGGAHGHVVVTMVAMAGLAAAISF